MTDAAPQAPAQPDAPPAKRPFSLSPKQLAYFNAPDRRINLLEGSIRSGKSKVSLLKWAIKTVAPAPRDCVFLMTGKTMTANRRNCLTVLQKMVGKANFQFSVTTKTATLFGHEVELEGANDIQAETKIQGGTYKNAYCDEIALYPPSFITMLLGRLSEVGAGLTGTCNPDHPKNYVKTDLIDKPGLDKAVHRFLLEDNIFLGQDYITNIKREYAGTVYYKRFIEGLWCQAEGVIYPVISATPERVVIDNLDPASVKYVIIGVDFGGHKSGDAFSAVGITKAGPVILDEEHVAGIKTPDVLNARFVAFVRKQMAAYKVYEVYVDSAEQTLKAGIEDALFKAKVVLNVRNAKKGPITGRIHLVNLLIGRGRFRILKHCSKTIEAFQQAVWDKRDDKDERLDDGTVNIDVLDAAEYALEPVAEIMIAEV